MEVFVSRSKYCMDVEGHLGVSCWAIATTPLLVDVMNCMYLHDDGFDDGTYSFGSDGLGGKREMGFWT